MSLWCAKDLYADALGRTLVRVTEHGIMDTLGYNLGNNEERIHARNEIHHQTRDEEQPRENRVRRAREYELARRALQARASNHDRSATEKTRPNQYTQDVKAENVEGGGGGHARVQSSSVTTTSAEGKASERRTSGPPTKRED